MKRWWCRAGMLAAVALAGATVHAAAVYNEVETRAAPTSVTMMAYSPATRVLLVKNTASAVVAVRIGTGETNTRLATWRFTDISISPSGRYAFVSDYGGENYYGDPLNPSYVHRLDLVTMLWEVRSAYVAGRIEAVSDTQVIVQSLDQWVGFINYSWGTGSALVPLNSSNSSYYGPEYSAGVYSGDIQYDYRTGRILHGDAGVSPPGMTGFKLVNNQFIRQEESEHLAAMYAGGGGTMVLSNDGKSFYYGRMQVDALDVTHTQRIFPEAIYAASGDIALGNGKYYDARTGALLGTLPFNTTTYAMFPAGNDFWAYNAATSTLHHFSLMLPAAEYGDLQFTAVSPCRLYDSRPAYGGSGVWIGGSVRPISVGPATSYASQGGSPTDCGLLAGMASGRVPAVLASVSTVNQSANGFLALYPSGDVNPFPTSVTQAYRTGSVQTAFVVMATNAAAPAIVSGYTTASTHVIIDIVGYFAKPKALALECQVSSAVTLPIAAGAEAQPVPASCAPGYTQVDTACEADSPLVRLFAVDGSCSYRNDDTVSRNVSAISRCCRAPGQ